MGTGKPAPDADVRPLLLAVDEDTSGLQILEHELGKRYGEDYDVRTVASAAEALRVLGRSRNRGQSVALVLADQWMSETEGVAFLGRVHEFDTTAKRDLLIRGGDRSSA